MPVRRSVSVSWLQEPELLVILGYLKPEMQPVRSGP